MKIKHIDKLITDNGNTSDIIQVVMTAYDMEDDPQIKELAYKLKGETIYDTCRNIWQYLIENIDYKADSDGNKGELIRTPARLIHDGTGDCKSYSLFTATVLRYLGVPHVFRFASYSSKKEATHVYVVAFDGDTEIVVDAVAKVQLGYDFDIEKKYNYKCDMENSGTKISYLAGIKSVGKIGKVSDVLPLSGIKYLDASLARFETANKYTPSDENTFLMRLCQLLVFLGSYYNLSLDKMYKAAQVVSNMAFNGDFYNYELPRLKEIYFASENAEITPEYMDMNTYNNIVANVLVQSNKLETGIGELNFVSDYGLIYSAEEKLADIKAGINADIYVAIWFLILLYSEADIKSKFLNSDSLIKRRKFVNIMMDSIESEAKTTEAYILSLVKAKIESHFAVTLEAHKRSLEAGGWVDSTLTQHILTHVQAFENILNIWFYKVEDGIIDYCTEMRYTAETSTSDTPTASTAELDYVSDYGLIYSADEKLADIKAAINKSVHIALWFLITLYDESVITDKFSNSTELLEKRKHVFIMISSIENEANTTASTIKGLVATKLQTYFGISLDALKDRIETGKWTWDAALTQNILTHVQAFENILNIWFYKVIDGIIDYHTEMVYGAVQGPILDEGGEDEGGEDDSPKEGDISADGLKIYKDGEWVDIKKKDSLLLGGGIVPMLIGGGLLMTLLMRGKVK